MSENLGCRQKKTIRAAVDLLYPRNKIVGEQAPLAGAFQRSTAPALALFGCLDHVHDEVALLKGQLALRICLAGEERLYSVARLCCAAFLWVHIEGQAHIGAAIFGR